MAGWRKAVVLGALALCAWVGCSDEEDVSADTTQTTSASGSSTASGGGAGAPMGGGGAGQGGAGQGGSAGQGGAGGIACLPVQPDAAEVCGAAVRNCGAFTAKDSCDDEVDLSCGDCMTNWGCHDGLCFHKLCYNNYQEPGEVQIDCGGSYCPKCPGSACTRDAQCRFGPCVASVCQ